MKGVSEIPGFEWHDSPVVSIEVGERGLCLRLLDWDEAANHYRVLEFRCSQAAELRLEMSGRFNPGDLGSMKVFDFSSSKDSAGRWRGEICLVFRSGSEGVWSIGFESADCEISQVGTMD